MEREDALQIPGDKEDSQCRGLKEGAPIVPQMVKVLHFVDVFSKCIEIQSKEGIVLLGSIEFDKEKVKELLSLSILTENVSPVGLERIEDVIESVFGPQQLLFLQADSKLAAKAAYTATPMVLFFATPSVLSL